MGGSSGDSTQHRGVIPDIIYPSLFDPDDVIPLISHDGASYRVDPEVVSFFREVRTPVALVAIAGRFRTGKSALINRLAGRKAAKSEDRAGVTRSLGWVRSKSNDGRPPPFELLWPDGTKLS
mgnify:CR=1 FL=1